MSLTVKERNEKENRLFPPLSVHFVSNTLCSRLQHTNMTVEKQAKRMLDPTVETTSFVIPKLYYQHHIRAVHWGS